MDTEDCNFSELTPRECYEKMRALLYDIVLHHVPPGAKAIIIFYNPEYNRVTAIGQHAESFAVLREACLGAAKNFDQAQAGRN